MTEFEGKIIGILSQIRDEFVLIRESVESIEEAQWDYEEDEEGDDDEPEPCAPAQGEKKAA